jgi:hypothetical protein
MEDFRVNWGLLLGLPVFVIGLALLIAPPLLFLLVPAILGWWLWATYSTGLAAFGCFLGNRIARRAPPVSAKALARLEPWFEPWERPTWAFAPGPLPPARRASLSANSASQLPRLPPPRGGVSQGR